jgi:UTP--glucose-1-phosphate uridylyltransferase
MKIEKAIIPVAGWGTRRLPVTKVIEKSMLPIGNRPLVDYVVEDCAKAGIKEVYLVIDEKPWSQVKAFYEQNGALEKYLVERGKADKVELVRTVPDGMKVNFFVQQDVDAKYGTAAPVAQVVEAFDITEPTAVLMGDDFIFNADGSSDLARLCEVVDGDDVSALLAVEIPLEEVERYGVLKIEDGMLTGIYEKPKKENAPSNYINISKYIMSRELLGRVRDYYRNNDFGPGDQEYLITDPIIEHIKAGGKIRVLPIKGEYLDGGSVEGWLHANMVVLGKD